MTGFCAPLPSASLEHFLVCDHVAGPLSVRYECADVSCIDGVYGDSREDGEDDEPEKKE